MAKTKEVYSVYGCDDNQVAGYTNQNLGVFTTAEKGIKAARSYISDAYGKGFDEDTDIVVEEVEGGFKVTDGYEGQIEFTVERVKVK